MTETLSFKPDENKAQYFDLKPNGDTSFSFDRVGTLSEGAHCWDRGAWKNGQLRLTNSIVTDYYTGTLSILFGCKKEQKVYFGFCISSQFKMFFELKKCYFLFLVTLEAFSALDINGVSVLPMSKTSEKTRGFDSEFGSYYQEKIEEVRSL